MKTWGGGRRSHVPQGAFRSAEGGVESWRLALRVGKYSAESNKSPVLHRHIN